MYWNSVSYCQTVTGRDYCWQPGLQGADQVQHTHKHLPPGNEILCGQTDEDNHQWKIMKRKISFIQILHTSNWNNSWWQFKCRHTHTNVQIKNSCRFSLREEKNTHPPPQKKYTHTDLNPLFVCIWTCILGDLSALGNVKCKHLSVFSIKSLHTTYTLVKSRQIFRN